MQRTDYSGVYLPGYQPTDEDELATPVGLSGIDHVVCNVELGKMDDWAGFYARILGFHQFRHFNDEDISTEYTALMSKVLWDGVGRIKLPINEPAEGKKKSQIEEYLDFYRGPGVQHLALSTGDIIADRPRAEPQRREVPRRPDSYYEDAKQRVGGIDESWDASPSSASSSTATTRATCCRSSPSRSRTGRRCSSRSSSATAPPGSASATSRPCSRPSSGPRGGAATSDGRAPPGRAPRRTGVSPDGRVGRSYGRRERHVRSPP